MALQDGEYPIEGKLIDLGTGALTQTEYGGGGSITEFGEVLSAHVVGFQRQGELLRGFNTNFWKYFRDFKFNVAYEVIISQRSANFIKLWSNRQYDDGKPLNIGRFNLSDAKPSGNLIHYDSKEVTRLMIRAQEATKPSLLLPAAVCVEAGPVTWELQGDHLAATALTIVGLYHPSCGSPFLEGDPADWPNLAALGSVGGNY